VLKRHSQPQLWNSADAEWETYSYNYSQRRTGGRSVAKLLLRYFNDSFVMSACGLIHIEYFEKLNIIQYG